jgi:MFS family permease
MVSGPARQEHRTVREHLLRAPWWVHSLMSGVPFGVVMALLERLRDDEPWGAAVSGGVPGGVLFGAVMGPFLQRQAARTLAATGPMAPWIRRAATRAAWRGPVPADPEVRAAALRVVDHQLAEWQRRRTFLVGTYAFFTGLCVVLALTSSAWWWLAALGFGGMLGVSVLMPGWLRRRRTLLQAAPPPP